MSVRTDLCEGREAGVPLCCCRLRFAIEYALDPDHEQAVHRRISLTRTLIEYVPCGIFHRATITHADYEQTLARR